MDKYVERASYEWTKDSVRLITTPSQMAKSTFYYVQEVGHFQTQPGYFTERQQLHSYLLVYTLSGTGHLHYQGKSYVLSPHQAFFIDCREYQFYKTDEACLWEILWVHFDGSNSRGYYEQFAKNGSPVVSFEADQGMPALIRQLIHIHHHQDVRTETLASKVLVELLTHLLLATNPPEHAGTFLPPVIENIVRELDRRFQEKISLDELAKQHAVSKFHLVRLLKKFTGYAPNEYIIHRRITYAKELLTYSDLTVAAIASEVGIDHVSHFIDLFKKRVDMTPLAYRKRWQRP